MHYMNTVAATLTQWHLLGTAHTRKYWWHRVGTTAAVSLCLTAGWRIKKDEVHWVLWIALALLAEQCKEHLVCEKPATIILSEKVHFRETQKEGQLNKNGKWQRRQILNQDATVLQRWLVRIRAFQFAIRFVLYKNRPFNSLVVMQLFLLIYCI